MGPATPKNTEKRRIRIIPNICLICKTDVLSSTGENRFDLEYMCGIFEDNTQVLSKHKPLLSRLYIAAGCHSSDVQIITDITLLVNTTHQH
jgi:hypothetical protein